MKIAANTEANFMENKKLCLSRVGGNPSSLRYRKFNHTRILEFMGFINVRSLAGISLVTCFAALVSACSSTPPPPDWQMNAQGSMERSIEGYLIGNVRVEAAEFARAKSEIARTGRADLLARVELMRCAARVASLVQDECEGFEKLRPDAAGAERAYADYLAGRAVPDTSLLPPQHRAITNEGAIQNIADPLSKLVAAGVIFRRGEASPALLSTAVETASAQGWRRPLLAWLGVQLIRAEKAADSAEADRLRRRIALVEGDAIGIVNPGEKKKS
jgi:hypothetical protein